MQALFHIRVSQIATKELTGVKRTASGEAEAEAAAESELNEGCPKLVADWNAERSIN